MLDVPGERELPERWGGGRKTEIVLRVLRGEDLRAVSREIQTSAAHGRRSVTSRMNSPKESKRPRIEEGYFE
jgi:hypothetical protein